MTALPEDADRVALSPAEALTAALAELGLQRDEFPSLPSAVQQERLIRGLELQRGLELGALHSGEPPVDFEQSVRAMEAGR